MEKKYAYNGVKVKGLSCEDVVDILKKHYGNKKLTAERVVNDAKASKHPLHNYFEWDDAIAGHLHRIQQARILIASLMELRDDGIKVRTFTNMMEDSNGNESIGFNAAESQYIDTDTIFENPELRSRLLEKAKREMLSFKNRYKNLLELAKVFEAIDSLV